MPGQVLERERPISLLDPPHHHDNRVEINQAQFIPFPGHVWPPLHSPSFHDFMLLALAASSPLLHMDGFEEVRELGVNLAHGPAKPRPTPGLDPAQVPAPTGVFMCSGLNPFSVPLCPSSGEGRCLHESDFFPCSRA